MTSDKLRVAREMCDARARMRTPTGRDVAVDRQTHAYQGAISELKHHGMRRARCRGTRRPQLQPLAAATAIDH